MNTFINCETGIMPAASNEIKEDLKIDNFGFGLLGSAVYAGNIINN
jgi:hypothetical protein